MINLRNQAQAVMLLYNYIYYYNTVSKYEVLVTRLLVHVT
jgi:hypothetical protein